MNWSFPRVDENWDGGLGFAAQVLLPLHLGSDTDVYHWGFSLGVNNWDANEDTLSITAGNAAGGSGALRGDIRSTTLGASVLRSGYLGNGLNITLETGLLYNHVSSDTDINITYANSATTSAELDIDNSFMGLIAIDANLKATEQCTVCGGVGYQFELGAGDASAFGDQEKNYNDAIFLRAGVRF
ncbi:MAG: hypothetical protein P8144_06290 [Gammaproteobacteria bacterium]